MSNREENVTTRVVARKPDPNWQPGETTKLPPIPATTYRAVLTCVRNVEKPQWLIEWEAERNNKTVAEIAKRQLEWVFHIKSNKKFRAIDPEDGVEKEFSVYDRELAAYTRVSLWSTSTAYKWATRLLGRDIEEGEEFDFGSLNGSRCMISVSLYTSKRTNKVRNQVDDLILPEDDADWSTDPPAGFSYVKSETHTTRPHIEEPPHPADDPGLSPAVQKFYAITKRKGMPQTDARALYIEYSNATWGSFIKLDDLNADDRKEVYKYFEDTYPDDEAADF